jgi:cytochrome c oxidase subunit 3
MSIWQQLTDKSWATQGVAGEIRDRSLGPGPAARTGLAFFMAVLTSMFMLFVVGYRLRMAESDWVSINDPNILWLNTGLLILGSVMMQRARTAARQGQIAGVRSNLALAGLFSITFLIGQVMAWQELSSMGFYARSNAAAAFFILLTTLHGIHLAGGLVVWLRAAWRAFQGIEVARVKLSIELCTTYWHYLLLVWFVFFTLFLST